ncbi:GerMN domain-containing protein [Bacillus sp. NTK071]|uniref:GerMN domain-containing protein n=1 Tax=Bacillus sp. NTK071 TaxID=2802175 RepID=UPI001A8CEF59|nr:GerMN domain-containing protein [Bacillus sp. NTK071]MBN8209187.1 GerMN domain-containing protein [Bacillus sp. NTK071]
MSDKTKSLLSQLPELKDQRNKETIYQNIQKKMNEPARSGKKKKKTPWIIPTFAAALVILLAVLITPELFNQNDGSTNLAITEESNEKSELADHSAASENDSQPEGTTEAPSNSSNDLAANTTIVKEEDPPLPKAEAKFEQYIPALQQTNGESVVLSYPDSESLLLVPISFKVDSSKTMANNIQDILSTFDASQYGLASSPLVDATFDVVTEDGTKTLVVSFEEPGDSLSSNESIMINDSVQQLAASLNAEEISWQTKGEEGYNLGNFGPADTSVNNKPSPYYLYETNTKNRFLVKGPTLQGEEGAQLDVALSQMKEGSKEATWYKPAIPSDVSIYSFEGDGSEATITFTKDSKFQSEEEALQTIEAIMLAASQYNYKTILFENTGFDQIGNYSLNEKLSVPQSPNAVQVK